MFEQGTACMQEWALLCVPAWWNRDSAACILGDVWTRLCTCWWIFFPSLVALEFWLSMWRFGLQFTHDVAIDVSLAWTRIVDWRLPRIATNRTFNLSLCVTVSLSLFPFSLVKRTPCGAITPPLVSLTFTWWKPSELPVFQIHSLEYSYQNGKIISVWIVSGFLLCCCGHPVDLQEQTCHFYSCSVVYIITLTKQRFA